MLFHIPWKGTDSTSQWKWRQRICGQVGFFRQGFTGASAASRGEQVCLLVCSQRRGGACSQRGLRVEVCQGVGLEGWPGWFAHPLGCGVCRVRAQYPAFAPGSSKVAFWIFGLFVSFVQNWPQLHITCIYFSPIQFLCILLLKERCVQVQALQPFGKGFQVPVCLIPLRDSTPLFFFFIIYTMHY